MAGEHIAARNKMSRKCYQLQALSQPTFRQAATAMAERLERQRNHRGESTPIMHVHGVAAACTCIAPCCARFEPSGRRLSLPTSSPSRRSTKTAMTSFPSLRSDDGLAALDKHLLTRSYIDGCDLADLFAIRLINQILMASGTRMLLDLPTMLLNAIAC